MKNKSFIIRSKMEVRDRRNRTLLSTLHLPANLIQLDHEKPWKTIEDIEAYRYALALANPELSFILVFEDEDYTQSLLPF